MSRLESLVDRLLGLPRPLLVGLDVDGTLAPIVKDPDAARIPEATLRTLASLSGAPGVHLALVTGRDLRSLERMESLPCIWRAVEHGGLVLGPDEAEAPRTLTEAQRDALSAFRRWVDSEAEGAFIEYKPQAIAMHVRSIAERDPVRADRLMEQADALATKLGLHVRRGKALREAEAVCNDKGVALAEIHERSGTRAVFFVGDDLTDFPAIRLGVERGVGAFVRSNEQHRAPPEGAFVFDGVEDVALVLQRLTDALLG